MNKAQMADVIARQAIKLEKQRLTIKAFKKAQNEIDGIIYGIGGPLNDNCLGFSKEQFSVFHEIHKTIIPIK